MIPLTLAEVAAATGGTLQDADPRVRITGSVEFDSRKVSTGGLFVAIPGARVDGHHFAAAALAAGAVAVLATRPVDGPSVRVHDPLLALGRLARAVVDRLPDLTVVGVTGSAGKTSTKDLLAQVLSRLGPTVAPPGSFNNELGHPWTVLRADRATRYLVLEKSARGLGHIRWLTEVAPPRIGVVLNVGAAHVGEFGSVDVTAAAKGELVEALPPAAAGGVAVLNADDPRVRAMAARTAARVVLVGTGSDVGSDAGPEVAVRAEDIALDPLGRPSFRLVTPAGAVPVTLGLHGTHHVGNALAVVAVALELGLDLPAVAEALGDAVPVSRHRMEVTRRADGVTVVDDSYNANPDSMRAALAALRAMTGTGRSWAVLGYMAELGEAAATEHTGIGRHVAELGIDRLVVVGAQAAPLADGAASAAAASGAATVVEVVPDADAAVALLAADLRPGDVVLVKASRSVALERVAAAVLAAAPTPAPAPKEAVPAGHPTGGGSAT